MFRESLQTKTARLKKIIAGFQKTYPDAHCELTYANPLQLLVAVILSAQCTDKRVNLITPELFKKYRTAKDFADAPRAELERFIKSAGFFRSKAKNIQNCCRKLVERHGGEVPRTMEELHRARRRRAQDGERRFRQRVRRDRRRRRGHARDAIVASARTWSRNGRRKKSNSR